MDPWYEATCPSETDVEKTMNRSDIYLCLNKDSNTDMENSYLCQVVSNVIKERRERAEPLKEYYDDGKTFKSITYESIRRHPDWKKLSDSILREEVISHKPYGSWRGFSTFVVGPLREAFIVRVIREIWAPHILETKLVPKWHDYNYSPDRNGYNRTKEHYYNISK